MSEPLILIVGAADTGRAPMAVALLRRMLRRQGAPWRVESAGVVGHDDDPAEPEARDALLAMGLDLSAHTARSLSDALVAEARLLVAVESGVGRVVRARYPAAQLSTAPKPFAQSALARGCDPTRWDQWRTRLARRR